ncbi:hypothetical protein KUL72_21915 [Bradyrhizobium arachidis]|uniref:hypothetical protein n=1 Tax=Bradyrhizobium arachidis TaxID=858423 RepID=UPI0021636A4D|nr:hypothetical protein [Bradyrhizobium arachidis]UVO34159.1 hypothetical protein KUL72_21915 [Bradyrhizobium arachidis]
MGNRTAKFISALIGSIIAGVPLAAVSQNAPVAPGAASTVNPASDCLTSPKGGAPQGQHWHYRVERGTKRQCWYLRAEGVKEPARAATTAQMASSTAQPDSPPPQSVQNAHAEYVAPQSAAPQAAPTAATAVPVTQPAPAANGDPQQPAVATRWPDAAPAAASPAPQPSPATTDAPAAPSTETSATPAASPAPVALAAADAPAEKPTGSLQMLLLVVGGALALAGVLASLIYRFAGGRARMQTADRRVNWDTRQDYDDSRAPWHGEPVPAPRVERPLPIDFDAVRPQARQIAAFSDAIGRIAAQGRPAAEVTVEEPDETEIDYFEGEFEIEAPAPQLAAAAHHEETADHDEDEHQEHVRDADSHEGPARNDNAIDIDIITAMLERLAAEGPRLTQPSFDASLEADLAALARSSRGRSAARA